MSVDQPFTGQGDYLGGEQRGVHSALPVISIMLAGLAQGVMTSHAASHAPHPG